MIEEKIWGTTECVLKTAMVEVHRLHVKPNSWCSLHRHAHKHNAFVVVDGYVEIRSYSKKGAKSFFTLVEGGFCTMPPGRDHQFVTYDDPCVMFEIYYLEPLDVDIERFTQGGSA